MVRTYKRKSNRAKTPNDVILQALRAVKIEGKTIRKTATEFEIPFRSLARYCSKVTKEQVTEMIEKSVITSFGYKSNGKVFTDKEEDFLADYIKKASDVYFGFLLPNEVKRLAYDFAKLLKINMPTYWVEHEMAGADWLSGFLKRHSSISIGISDSINSNKITGLSCNNTNYFFDNYKFNMEHFQFNPLDIWNVDEICINTSQKSKRLILISDLNQVNKAIVTEQSNQINFIVAVSAGGNTISPFSVSACDNHQDDLLTNASTESIKSSNDFGWTKDGHFCQFLKHFVTVVKCSKEKPVLLLLYYHKTHLCVSTLDYARENGIYMLPFPPASVYRVQPLGSSIYQQFERCINTTYDKWVYNHQEETMNTNDFLEIVNIAFLLVATPDNIKAGFKATGICPFNKDTFQDSDFKPG